MLHTHESIHFTTLVWSFHKDDGVPGRKFYFQLTVAGRKCLLSSRILNEPSSWLKRILQQNNRNNQPINNFNEPIFSFFKRKKSSFLLLGPIDHHNPRQRLDTPKQHFLGKPKQRRHRSDKNNGES